MNDSTVRDIDDHEKDVALRVDFSAIVQFHVSEVVHTLVAEHDRIMEALWSENQNLRVQMGQGDNKAALNEVWEHPVVLQDDKSTNLATGKSSPVSLAPRTSAMNTVDSLQFHPSDSWWKGRLKRMILSGRFDSIVGGIIVLNTLVMSLELEYSGRKFEDEVMRNCVHSLPTSVTTSVNATTFVKCEAQSDYYDTFFIAMEHFFTGAFALELFLRLVVQGCGYLRHPSNFLDAIIVVTSMADSWMPLGGSGGDVLGSVAVLRLMRLMRLAKVLRVVRVMKAFKSLRVLVTAVVNSVGALGWSMTLLFVLMLLGAIFMAQVIQPFMEDTEDEELRKFIFSRFGTWTNSMFTVFEITMAPGGFIQYRRLFEEVHPFFGLFTILYVCLVTFAVVRVITAMFLKTTLSASDSEEQATAKEKSKEWSEYVKTFERMAGSGGSGTITLNEIDTLLATPKFSKWMEDAGLSCEEILRIFRSLGEDRGFTEVLFSDFENAIQHMLGLPRAADVVINLYECRNIMDRITAIETMIKEERLSQEKRVNELLTRSVSRESVDASDFKKLGSRATSVKSRISAVSHALHKGQNAVFQKVGL